MSKKNARKELFYLTDTDPSADPEDPTNYTKVANVSSNSHAVSRNLIPNDDKDSGEGSNHLYGRLSSQVPCSGNRDFAGDDGVLLARDAAMNATGLWFLRTTNVVGDEASYGECKIGSYDEGSDDETQGTFSFTAEVQGVPTFFTVTT